MARLWLWLAFLICFCTPARAEITASLAEGSGGRAWEIVSVRISPAPLANDQISIADIRGGIRIVVSATGEQTLIPLPVITPSEFSAIHIQLRRGNRVIEQSTTKLYLAAGSFRVGYPAALNTGLLTALPWNTQHQIILQSMTVDDLQRGPTLLFATCDAVVIPDDLSLGRALELINAGTRVVRLSSTPPAGTLSRLVWEPLGPNAWIAPAIATHKPTLVHESLTQSAVLRRPLNAAPGFIGICLALGPLAMLLTLLMRGLFRRRWVVALAVGIALAGLSGGGVMYAMSRGPSTTLLAQWDMARVPGDTPSQAVWLHERFTQSITPVTSTLALQETGHILLPFAGSPTEYWNLSGLFLAGTGAELSGSLPPRTVLLVESRSISLTEGIIRIPPSGDGLPIVGGYIETAAGRQLLSQWVQSDDLRAWYDLRFQGDRRYWVSGLQTAPRIIDFSPSPPSLAAPTP